FQTGNIAWIAHQDLMNADTHNATPFRSGHTRPDAKPSNRIAMNSTMWNARLIAVGEVSSEGHAANGAAEARRRRPWCAAQRWREVADTRLVDPCCACRKLRRPNSRRTV